MSPVWCEPIVFEYVPNSFASIVVKIFDKNDNQEDKEMGVARFDVSSILSSKTCMKAKRLEKGGWIFVHAEALSQDTPQKDVTVTLEGRDLKNVEGMMKGVSDPFFVFSRRDGNGDWREIYRSEHIPNNLNPTWNQASINYRRLCGNSDTVPFRINVYDHEKSGKHRDMGSQKRDVIRFTARFSLKVQVSRGVESLAALTVQEGDIHQPTSWSRGRKDTFI